MWPFSSGCGEHHFGDPKIIDIGVHKNDTYGGGLQKYQLKKKCRYYCQHEGCDMTKVKTELIMEKNVVGITPEDVEEELEDFFIDL